MCAVYSPTVNQDWVQSTFGLVLPSPVLPAAAKEVYPGYQGPIVVRSQRDGRTALGLANFGLIPPWARDNKIARHTYNARLETVDSKPSYRDAWRHAHWAIVLADAFYEPCYETGRAVRWQIALGNGEPMGIAGLWQRWREPKTDQVVASFTMLTINADGHPLMSRLHKPDDEKRTPVVLAQASFEGWLSAGVQDARQYLSLAQMPELVGHPLEIPAK